MKTNKKPVETQDVAAIVKADYRWQYPIDVEYSC
jgi:hypothetical protein